jgi:hypothetical protein
MTRLNNLRVMIALGIRFAIFCFLRIEKRKQKNTFYCNPSYKYCWKGEALIGEVAEEQHLT